MHTLKLLDFHLLRKKISQLKDRLTFICRATVIMIIWRLLLKYVKNFCWHFERSNFTNMFFFENYAFCRLTSLRSVHFFMTSMKKMKFARHYKLCIYWLTYLIQYYINALKSNVKIRYRLICTNKFKVYFFRELIIFEVKNIFFHHRTINLILRNLNFKDINNTAEVQSKISFIRF